jgi:DNA recombination protein RmuC
MTTAVFLMLGMVAGGAIGLWVGGLRARREAAAEILQLTCDVSSAQATLQELRVQLSGRDGEIAVLRKAIDLEKESSTDARARLDAARVHFAEQRQQIEEMEKKVKATFAELSGAALKSSSEQFITLADAKLQPLKQQLERYEKQISELEKTRATAYGGLDQKLTSLEQSEARLLAETGQLVAALRQPGAKGKWGEVTLQRIVELAGMSSYCDFSTQATNEGGQRPDLVVKLPNQRTLVVDSKVNATAYLDAVNATTDDDRRRHLQRYAGAVRATLKSLGGKEYWKQFSPAPEFVVMFMPGEAFFSAALAEDPDLIIDGVDAGVILASPTTLVALLMAVRHGWQQQQVAENAERIAAAGRELYDRLCTFAKHLDGVRGGLAKAAEAFNSAVGSFTTRTLPAASKLKELGAATDSADLVTLQMVDASLRALPVYEDERGETRQAV